MNIISAILALFGHRMQQRALHVIERVLRHEKVNYRVIFLKGKK